MITYGVFWKSLFFCLSLGSYVEFHLYPHHGISKIHQRSRGEIWELIPWNAGSPELFYENLDVLTMEPEQLNILDPNKKLYFNRLNP